MWTWDHDAELLAVIEQCHLDLYAEADGEIVVALNMVNPRCPKNLYSPYHHVVVTPVRSIVIADVVPIPVVAVPSRRMVMATLVDAVPILGQDHDRHIW